MAGGPPGFDSQGATAQPAANIGSNITWEVEEDGTGIAGGKNAHLAVVPSTTEPEPEPEPEPESESEPEPEPELPKRDSRMVAKVRADLLALEIGRLRSHAIELGLSCEKVDMVLNADNPKYELALTNAPCPSAFARCL
ncbi:hypothetical protein N9K47_00060 [bacterium]|nr:hypothetical protein [bacterium]